MNTTLKKTTALKYEKQGKRVTLSKKKQSNLRKSVKLAQAILEKKEEVVRRKEKKAPLYGKTGIRTALGTSGDRRPT